MPSSTSSSLPRSPLRSRAPLGGLLALAMLVGCGSSTPEGTTTPQQITINDIRERAINNPNDPNAAYDVAMAETFMHNANPEVSESQLERALALRPEDPRLHVTLALERARHGHPAPALESFINSIEAARTSNAPYAPWVAELSAGLVGDLADAVPTFRADFGARLEGWLAEPGNLGPAATRSLVATAVNLRRLRDDPAGAAQLAATHGCVQSFNVAGPFGPYPNTLFGSEDPRTAAGALSGEYELGPRRGSHAPHTVGTMGCGVSLGNQEVRQGGIFIAKSAIEAPAEGTYWITFNTPNNAELYIDGTRVARIDRRTRLHPRVHYLAVPLTAGRHEVGVRIASQHPNPALSVMLGDRVTEQTQKAGELPDATDGFTRYLRVALAMLRGDPLEARESLGDLEPIAEASPAMLQFGGVVALSDPFAPADQARDRARNLYRAAVSRDANAWFPYVQNAQLAARDGSLQPAIAAMSEAEERWPELASVAVTHAELLEMKSWTAQAERASERAYRIAPHSCGVIGRMLSYAEARGRHDDIQRWIAELVSCDATSTARLSRLTRERRWEEAGVEVERLARFTPEDKRHSLDDLRRELAAGRGDDETVRRLELEALERQPDHAGNLLREVDYDLLAGEEARAFDRLNRALEDDPEGNARFREVLRTLGQPWGLENYRLNGAEIIREFEASGRNYAAPQVLVLDYTVERFFEDGSSMVLTHNIFRVQSEEAIESLGEYQPPAGVNMIKLRTVKADGALLEPDYIPNKPTISMPNLAIGDYVEFEWVRTRGAPSAFPNGFLGMGFRFQSFSVPFDRSELIAIMPASLEPIIEVTNNGPQTEERTEGDLKIYRWIKTESEPREPEPMSVQPSEILPLVRYGVGASWDDLSAALREGLMTTNLYDPAAARKVREILGGEPSEMSDEVKTQKIFSWVVANIEPGGSAGGQAAAMVAAEAGNQVRVLHYLLRLAGVTAHLALSKDKTQPQRESAIPEEGMYQHLLVVTGSPTEPKFLWAGARGTPFGYVPAHLRGQDAIVLAGNGMHVSVPEDAAVDDLAMLVDMRLNQDGSAVVTIEERHRGAGAIDWRGNLEGVPEAELDRRFEEGYVSRLAPGATLRELEIANREDAEQPFVLRYSFNVPALGRASGERWMVPGFMPSSLSARFASAASRTITQLVASPVHASVRTVIHLPAGARSLDQPGETNLEALDARFRMSIVATEDGVQLDRRVDVPIMRVEPGAYSGWAQFCRMVDEAEQHEVPVDLTP